MSIFISKRTFLLLLAACAVTGAVWAAQDPFVAEWKLNPSRSKLTDQMKVESLGGNKYAFDFGGGAERIVADGTDQRGIYGTLLSVSVEGPDTWKVVRKKDGCMLLTATKQFVTMCLSGLQLFFFMFTAAANQGRRANFVIAPARPSIDERLSIVISGLPPNRLITVSAKSKAQDELWGRSEAVFDSGPKGTIDLAAQAPVSGTYRGVEGMGLFWSIKPEVNRKSGDHAFFAITDWFQPIVTQMEAADADQVLGSAVTERRFAKPGIPRSDPRYPALLKKMNLAEAFCATSRCG